MLAVLLKPTGCGTPLSQPESTLGACSAQTRWTECLSAVQRGLCLTITRRGKPVATLAPPTPEQAGKVDKNGWPVGYFERTYGSMPDLKRWPQGEPDKREW